jgi:hypothetical protein
MSFSDFAAGLRAVPGGAGIGNWITAALVVIVSTSSMMRTARQPFADPTAHREGV